MLVDSHCHLTGGGQNVVEIIQRAKLAQVIGFIAVATDFEDSELVIELSKRHPEIQCSIGLHPHEAKRWDDEILFQGKNCKYKDALEELSQNASVRFIGETGLDGHYNFSSIKEQEIAFREQINLARQVKKPLVIHTREAADLTLEILKEEYADEIGGIIHCFSESKAFASRALDMGFYISFSGILTFKNSTSIQEVAKWAPMDRILLETDSPYLAPVPYRGKTNEPAYLRHIAECLAGFRNMTLAAIAEKTTNNLEVLCDWRSPFL